MSPGRPPAPAPAAVTPPGYSGKPVAQKLGFRDGTRWALRHAPPDARRLLGALPDGAAEQPAGAAALDLVVLFVTEARVLRAELAEAAATLRPDGMLWVAWPKRASKVATDVTEDRVREIALPTGLVDVKVCAISDVWSGLKLVWRVDRRAAR